LRPAPRLAASRTAALRVCLDSRGAGAGPLDRRRSRLTTRGGPMLAIWVKVRIKPELRQRFLDAIEGDALGSERDEPGCLRFNVLQDQHDANVYYFYEVYADAAALEAHRATPHYAVWQAVADTLDGPAEATRCRPVFPAAPAYWRKPARGSHA